MRLKALPVLISFSLMTASGLHAQAVAVNQDSLRADRDKLAVVHLERVVRAQVGRSAAETGERLVIGQPRPRWWRDARSARWSRRRMGPGWSATAIINPRNKQ